MTVGDLIEKLKSFDADCPVILGADGAHLGAAKGVYAIKDEEDEVGIVHVRTVVIAEWEAEWGHGRTE